MSAGVDANRDLSAEHIRQPLDLKSADAQPSGLMPYFLLAPLAVLLTVFIFLPTFLSIGLAFFKIDILASKVTFIGWANFLQAYQRGDVGNSLRVTLVYTLLTVPPSVFLGLLSALAIHALQYGKAFWRAVYFLPVAATLVAMSVVWRWMFLPRTGVVDQLLSPWTGLADWLNSTDLAIYAVAVVGNWQQIGFVAVLYLAGLATVPKDVLEAARVDGAGPLNRFFHVTWPALGPTTVFAVVVTTMHSLKVFDTVATMTSGGPSGSTESLAYLLWQRGIYFFDIGGGAVVTQLLLVLAIVVTVAQIILSRRLETGGSR